jgi:hypothetical protein
MRPTNPLKKNDNPYPDTFRVIVATAALNFPSHCHRCAKILLQQQREKI